MKTIMKYFGLITMLMLVSIVLNAQPQPGDCNEENVTLRTAKNAWIVGLADTPFDTDQLNRFKGLDYYGIDCSKRMKGILKVNVSDENVEKVNGETVDLLKYGTVSFQYEGHDYEMIVYQDKYNNMEEFKQSGTFFIPFKDASNNDSPDTKVGTWKDGRYLIIDKPVQGKKVILDFNRAVNPYDAYNAKGTTLVISGGNEIKAPVPVGERKYEDRTR